MEPTLAVELDTRATDMCVPPSFPPSLQHSHTFPNYSSFSDQPSAGTTGTNQPTSYSRHGTNVGWGHGPCKVSSGLGAAWAMHTHYAPYHGKGKESQWPVAWKCFPFQFFSPSLLSLLLPSLPSSPARSTKILPAISSAPLPHTPGTQAGEHRQLVSSALHCARICCCMQHTRRHSYDMARPTSHTHHHPATHWPARPVRSSVSHEESVASTPASRWRDSMATLWVSALGLLP